MDSDGSCSASMEESERPDLSLLKPLWSLYTSMLEKEGGNYKQSFYSTRVSRGNDTSMMEHVFSSFSSSVMLGLL